MLLNCSLDQSDRFDKTCDETGRFATPIYLLFFCAAVCKCRMGILSKNMYMQCFVIFNNVYKIVRDMIGFRNPYLVKSVNFAQLLLSVYHDIALNNVKVNMRTSSFNAVAD